MNKVLRQTKDQRSQDHYNDGMIDFRVIPSKPDGFSEEIAVFVNINGNALTVTTSDPMFVINDLVMTYKRMWRPDWNMEDEFDDYLDAFKKYLIWLGCNPEEIGE